MKPMIWGFVAMGVISVAAYFGLHELGFSAADVGSTGNVRLD